MARTLGYRADAEQSRLRRVDDRREALDSVGAEVGNGEGTAAEQVGADASRAALSGKLLDLARDLEQGLGIGVEDGRYHKSAVGIDRDAEVDVLILTHLVILDHKSVEVGR